MQINNYEVKHEVVEGVDHYSYFACNCAGDDKMFWEKALDSHLPNSGIDPVTSLVMELTHCYNASVQGIGCDMWFGISISAGRGHWEDDTFKNFIYEKQCELYIECDQIPHGLLAAIMILKELGYDEERTGE